MSKTNLLILIPSTYVCMCLCKVCDERGGRGKGEGGGSMSAAVKVKSLNPFAEGGGGELNQ